MPQEINEVNRSSNSEQMLETQHNSEQKPTNQISPILQKRNRQQQPPKQEPIVLKMNVINHQQPRRPNHQNTDEIPPQSLHLSSQSVNTEEETEIGEDNGDALEVDDGVCAVIETFVKIHDLGIEETSEEGEEALEVGEERRVVERPLAGLVEVPFGERERVRDRQPVTVDLEVGTSVRRDKEELHCGRCGEEPEEEVSPVAVHLGSDFTVNVCYKNPLMGRGKAHDGR